MNRVRKSKRPLAPRKVPTECLSCGEPQPWVVNTVEFSSPFRGAQHTVSASVNQCRHCEAISTSPEQIEAISAKVREAHKGWVAARFKKAMKELGLTIDGFVKESGLPRATVARASSGEPLIEASNEKLLWHEIEALRHKRIAWICTARTSSSIRSSRLTITIQQPMRETALDAPYSKLMKTAERSPYIRLWNEPEREYAPSFMQIQYV